MSTCGVIDCDRLTKGNGLCLKHYMQAYRRRKNPGYWERRQLSKLLRIISIKLACGVPECVRPHHANGMCQTHYKRMWREANPEPRSSRTELHYAEGYRSERVKGEGCRTCGLRGPDPCSFCVAESRGSHIHHSEPLY